jgi:flagellar motor switch protein FliN/FliY
MVDNKTLEDAKQPEAREARPREDSAQAPEYPSFSGGMEGKPDGDAAAGRVRDIELLKDVELEVTVELGRTRMSIGAVMELGQGSVIELDKLAGEPVDIRVNGILMASGEVIVLDDVFGVRITRLKERMERFQVTG